MTPAKFVIYYKVCLRRAFPGAWAAAWISSAALGIIGLSIAVFRLCQEEVDKRIQAEKEVGCLREKLREKTNKGAIRRELDKLIREGLDLQNRVKESHQTHQPSEFQKEVGSWKERATALIQTHFSEYHGYFLSDSGLTATFYPGHSERANLINFLGHRISRLSELLEKV
jgi:hypothetical protein